jgi:hypothetical protein
MTTTNISTPSSGDTLEARLNYTDSPISVTFYVNDSLVSTHTTNIPSGTSAATSIIQIYIENLSSAASNRKITIGEFKFNAGF